jgi:hypothetical protein
MGSRSFERRVSLMQIPAPNATPERRSMPVDEMMDAIEPDQADEDEIDRDDIVEEPRHDQDQYAGNDGDERRDMGSGDDHGFSSAVGDDWMS